MIEGFEFTFLVGAFWFPIYWIFGSVIFAMITFLKVIKLRKVRFSCLFTLLSLGLAYGAGYSGMVLGHSEITICLAEADGFVDQISGVIGCGILSFFLAGVVGFGLLVALGFLVLIVSRATNQSWVDTDEGVREETDLIFDLE